MIRIALFFSLFSILALNHAIADEAPKPDDTAKPAEPAKPADPFAFADFSWVPGNYGPPESILSSKYFVPEIRLDVAYNYDFNHPADHTISGSSEVFRSNEFQITQIGVGGDFSYKDVGFRLMTQFGMYSTTTPRNDGSPSRGQWDLSDAYRYISEAYATYHIDAMSGINIQAGLFMSYVGLWSYYNFDNWTYQPSYVSSNTPWFFNGMRVQIFTSDKLKIEPWLINGWQSYGMFNEQPGLGLQILYRPNGWLSLLGNQYYGSDQLNSPGMHRYHTDDSVMVKYYENPKNTITKAAASLTVDAGFQSGDGATSSNDYFLGFMAYNRIWLFQDHFGVTLGGGAIQNPGRYLVLLPPINGATAATGSAYFPENPGNPFWAWDMQLTTDYMPTRNITFRLEYTHRWSSVPYWSGPGGITAPTSPPPAGWQPDLVQNEDRITLAMMIRF